MEHFFQSAWAVAVEYWQTIAGYFFMFLTTLVAFSMSMYRTAAEKGKADWLESSMCALFAFGTWFALGFLNLPDGVGVLVGGFIGHIGTVKYSNFIKQKLGMQ